MLVVDDFSLFFNFLFAGVAAVIILASVDLLERNRFQAEYVALVLASTVGMMLMASDGRPDRDLRGAGAAGDLLLHAGRRFIKDGRSSEAALKYLLLGAVSTALTLYGMAYLFGLSGSTNLNDIAAFVSDADSGTRSALVLAAVFLAAGLGFKMAVVPFQMWVPDVYQGAPTPVTAYLSVASKAAGFAVVMRIFVVALGEGLISSDWSNMFAAIAAISMTLGNVAALVQTDIKRMLGYSSIAQAGTFLIGLAAVAAEDPQLLLGTSAVVFFLGTYAFTNLGAFIAIIAISNKIGSDQISDYAGVAKRSPWLAAGLTACLHLADRHPADGGLLGEGVRVQRGGGGGPRVAGARRRAEQRDLGVLLPACGAEHVHAGTRKRGDVPAEPVPGAGDGGGGDRPCSRSGVYPEPLLDASESAAEVFRA